METEFGSADEVKAKEKAGGREEGTKEKEVGQNDTGKGVADGSDLSESKLFHNGANASRSVVPTPCENATTGVPAQLTIFYGGSVNVFDGIPPEKVREILLIASAAATTTNSVDIKSIGTTSSPALTRSPSLQSTSTAIASPRAQPYPVQNSFCKLQAELPLARKHSLQQFFKKRRDRLMSKSPYAARSGAKTSDKSKANINDEKSPDADHFEKPAMPQEELQPKAAANIV